LEYLTPKMLHTLDWLRTLETQRYDKYSCSEAIFTSFRHFALPHAVISLATAKARELGSPDLLFE
jgi:hypothetical protein